jgi:hypothetical protein
MILDILRRIFSLSTVALITALTLSGIAAWYSILGLTAIFAAAVLPIIIMGASLEFSKVVVTVWLHRYWDKASLALKLYLLPAVLVLALITSMGIFGFLSKAHLDQTVPTGDVAAQVYLIDEKIKIERDNIENARTLIKQMDDVVNGITAKGESREITRRDGTTYVQSPAELALSTRRSQASDRARLTTEIEQANARIIKLQEEKAPIATQLRKVEAEVGPIKYIAALIYGDEIQNDVNALEKAVRWVIILLVLVFDPLALVLIMAALSSYRWEFGDKKIKPEPIEDPKYEKDDGPLTDDQIEQIKESVPEPIQEPTAADMELTADSVVATNLKKKEEQSPKRSDQTEQESQQSEQSQNQENENSETEQNQNQLQNLSQSIKKLNFNLKEKFSWKNLTDWNKSPTLNLVKKLLPPKR